MRIVSSSRSRNHTGTLSGRPSGRTVVNHAIRFARNRPSTWPRRSSGRYEVSSMQSILAGAAPGRTRSIRAVRWDPGRGEPLTGAVTRPGPLGPACSETLLWVLRDAARPDLETVQNEPTAREPVGGVPPT